MAATSLSKELFNDYEGFVEKFKPKKTTDDCYTPPNIYDAVAGWVEKEYGLNRADFVRPFYPGGDYENYNYPAGCVVVDNPPFSMSAKIYDFYIKHDIKFFLFAPALTCFRCMCSPERSKQLCAITTGAEIMYENGAVVSTSFATNLDKYQVRTAPDLRKLIEEENKKNTVKIRKQLAKYMFPDNILTSAAGQKLSKYGIDYRVRRGEAVHVYSLDSQKELKKTIYGGGLLLSEKAAAEKAAAEKAAAEKAGAIVWTLSEREKEIIRKLGEKE